MPEETKKKGYGGEKRSVEKALQKKASPRKLKTKKVQTLQERVLGDKTIVRKMTPTPGMKNSAFGDKLKKVASDAKAGDAFSGVLSPEKVEDRNTKKVRKLKARTAKLKARTAKKEAKVKKILTRKQMQAARKGYTVHIGNLEKAKKTVGND